MFDQVEELVLHLRREPAEDCELDASLLAVEVTARPRQPAAHLTLPSTSQVRSSSAVTSTPVSSE